MMWQILAPAAATALAMTAVLLWRQAALPGRKQLVFSLMFGALYFLVQGFRPALDLLLPAVLLGPWACNHALRAGFEAPPWPRWSVPVAASALVGAGMYAYVFHGPYGAWLFNGLALLLFLDAVRVAWQSLPDDLVEVRRKARLWLLAASAGLSALIAIPSVLGYGAFALPAGAAATIALCLALVAFGPRIVAAPAQEAALDARDRAVLLRLQALMVKEALYRDPGLTLSRLAQRLEVPEHRLRRIIHVGERKRNFSAWLNGLRIDEVKAGLDGDGTILDLALAAGYSSLSVFNRAFREAEGMTPSAWRAARKPALTAKTPASRTKTTEAASDA